MAPRAVTTTAVAAVVAAACTLVLCCVSTGARGYDYVPVTSIMFAGSTGGVRSADAATCLEHGGYLASEATAFLHEADVQAIEQEGLTTYYSFLGGGILQAPTMESNEFGFCPFDARDPDFRVSVFPQTSGNLSVCYWRWSVGRWLEMPSSSGLPYDIGKVGIIFYRGYSSSDQYRVNGFPSFFPYTASVPHPNAYLGHQLVLTRNAAYPNKAVWVDNWASGGYSYAGITAEFPAGSTPASTLKDWKVVCQSQGPLRLNYEMANTTSQLQERWWAIYFTILFVLCLITFLVVALCQEREDMDEPPEDAPEWAEKETAQRSVSHRYVSQRSFRRDTSSTGSSGGDNSSHGSNFSKEEEYEDVETVRV
ncbi:hypothetical protein NESM_000788800 [Novymonas esmeraldas]|uniref:Uncharacterized protein n=1 Tax=Novymonas esmeraldas TaxID=1808958 RepID=A0AAW0EVL2_9TRYP